MSSPTYGPFSLRTLGRFLLRTVTSFVILVMLLGAGGDLGNDELKGRFVSYLYPFLFAVAGATAGLFAHIRTIGTVAPPVTSAIIGVCLLAMPILLAAGLHAIARDLNAGR